MQQELKSAIVFYRSLSYLFHNLFALNNLQQRSGFWAPAALNKCSLRLYLVYPFYNATCETEKEAQ
jgi:hypothetical protein